MIGSQIARYVVLKPLGEGAMGAVYLVEHIDLKTFHAIKVLAPHQSRHPQVVQRFRNEARAAAVARSPNIVAVRDLGQLEDGCWYLVMDYWDGRTLSEFLGSRGPLPHDAILRIAADTLNGLAAAHRHRIVHRDIKPENLYLAEVDDDVRTMILDFGVCRLGDESGVTRGGVVLGTPRYMAPEQLRGELVDHRADLWALGAILYEMATGGWLPYDDDTGPRGQVLDDDVMAARMAFPAVDPQRRHAGISRALADAILAMIDPVPVRRPPSAADCAVLLAATLPRDGHEPGGFDIVKERAPELLRRTRDPRRSSGPVVVSRGLTSRYAIHDKLGSGSVAEVFRADVVGLDGPPRPVALKRVLAGYSELPAFAAAFYEQARIAACLSHRNVVQVLEFDRDAAGRLFLVMEHVGGKDLGALLGPGRLAPSIALHVAAEVLCGLAYAHALLDPQGGIHGLVHGALSPRNVLVSWDGAVKLSDFGIARALGAVPAGARRGALAGAPGYVSPEQAEGAPVDGRSDLFSVGVLLWEMLTGTRLFHGDSSRESLTQLMFRDAPRPSAVQPAIPADLEAVTMKLLARDRAARYASAELAREALARCADRPTEGRCELTRLVAGRFAVEVGPHAPAAVEPEPAAPPSGAGEPTIDVAPRAQVWVDDAPRTTASVILTSEKVSAIEAAR